MKKKSPWIQIASILCSGIILVGASALFIKNASDLLQGNVLNADLPDEIEKVALPVNYEARMAKGDALFQAEYFTLAATEYAFAINLEPKNPAAYLSLGKTYLEMGENQEAVEQFKLASELNPSSTESSALYGHALIRNRQFQEAQNVFDSFVKEVQEAQYFGALLDSYFGRFDDAEKKLNKAKELAGSIPGEDIQLFLNAYANFEDQQQGQDIYLKTLLAEAMVDVEEYELAEGLALDVLSVKSDYRDAWIILGYSKLKTEAYQDAEDAFAQAKKLDAIKPETHYFLGTAHYLQEEYEEAIKEFELALLYGFQPQIEAYHKIAESQLFLERYEDALASYEHLVKIDHSNVELFVRPVWISITFIKDLDRALTLAQEATSRFPGEAQSHNLLGWVYVEKDALDEAQQSLEKAILLNGNLAEAHYNLGRLYEKKGELENAKSEYKKAHES